MGCGRVWNVQFVSGQNVDFDNFFTGTSSSRKAQLLASGLTVRRVSPTIGMAGVTPVSRPPPTPFPHMSPSLYPTRPTPAASLPSGTNTDSNPTKFSDVELDSMSRRPFTKSISTVMPSPGLSPCRRQPTGPSLFGHSPRPLPCVASTASLAAACGSSSATLDAATRLRDFRALIDEMRATLLHHDSREELDAGNGGGDDEEERERLLRLLEDVMRKVKRLAEEDTVGLGIHVLSL